MFNLPNLPWNLIGYALGILGLFLAGYWFRANKAEKEKFKAEIEQKDDINNAQNKVINLEHEKQKRLEELNEVFKNHDVGNITKFANRLFSIIFKKTDR